MDLLAGSFLLSKAAGESCNDTISLRPWESVGPAFIVLITVAAAKDVPLTALA